jgi:predicted anti-sigma-YlaC factor YlaD
MLKFGALPAADMTRFPSRSASPVRSAALALALGAALWPLSGCGAVKHKAMGMVAESLSAGGDTFTRDDDPDLVGAALPALLKVYESLLDASPKDPKLLTATCAAFTQYAYGWVEADAEAAEFVNHEDGKRLQGRALRLFLRAKGYCVRALEVRFPGIGKVLIQDPTPAIAKATRKDVEMLYWTAASWGLAISLQSDLAIDLPSVRALAERGLALDETWSKGALHELMITLDSQSEAVGGNEARARQHFARAVELQKGLSPDPYFALAMGVSVARQDRAEFQKLMDQALAVDPEKDPSNRLVILLTQKRAKVQLDHIDTLFAK